MHDNHSLEYGHISLAVAIFGTVFGWISSHNISENVKMISFIISGCAGLMAMRYYYYATKKVKRKP